MNEREFISENLIRQIKYSRKTGAQIARELEIDPSTIFHYLNGNALPTIEKIRRLCEILGCTYEDIFGKIN